MELLLLSAAVYKRHQKSLLGSHITVIRLSFPSIPQRALAMLLKYPYIDFVLALRCIWSFKQGLGSHSTGGDNASPTFERVAPKWQLVLPSIVGVTGYTDHTARKCPSFQDCFKCKTTRRDNKQVPFRRPVRLPPNRLDYCGHCPSTRLRHQPAGNWTIRHRHIPGLL